MKVIRIYIWADIVNNEMFNKIVKKNKKRLNDYFIVMIFDSSKEMYDKVDIIEKQCETPLENERDYLARTLICREKLYKDDNPEIWNYSKRQGFLFFYDENKLSFNTVSHEVSHAVIGYMGAYFKNKLKFKSYEDTEKDNNVLYEELFCYITGSLNNQIVINV